jgi:DNA polymerase III subunit gamma/tau
VRDSPVGVGRLRRTVPAEEHTQDEQRRQPPQQQRSLYRRHRPRTFAEVVGQEPVVRTLRNAVQREQVHHAYLFVGSRGTGKTSMAKILAACLNCERGPTIEPCGQCESCASIARASSLDVIEMDAASNNSVDDIRELRESVAYAPVSGRRKVYILDEAHMLSTAAWNAFLKTLEEPPANTVFVLATTEANKVPATVVDRCHRFDFQRPTVEQLASVVRRVAAAESIAIPPEAVAALARSATGSFRDALGTLEQLVTYSGPEIALADVLAVLGAADARLLEETVDALAAGDAKRALTALEQSAQQGRDAASFASDLEVRARELMVVQTLGQVPSELALTAEADAALLAQAERVEHPLVLRLLELLGEAMEAVRAGADARTRLELALVKAARPEGDGSMRALLARIERLEHGMVDGRAPERRDAGRGAAAAEEHGEAAEGHGDAAEERVEEHGDAAEGHGDAAEERVEAAEERVEAAEEREEARPDARPAPAAVAEDGRPVGSPRAAAADPPEQAQANAASDESPQSPPPELARELEAVLRWWPAVVDLVRGENGMLGACIAEAQPVALDGEELTLAFTSTARFHKKKAEDPGNRLAVGEALAAVAGGRWRLRYELRDEPGAGVDAESGERSEEEWVARFMKEFDAEEIDGAADGGRDAGSAQDGGRDAGSAREAQTQDDDGGAAALTSNEKGA